MSGLGAAETKAMLLAVCERMLQAAPHLNELDAVAGDGDLGESMRIGFGAAAELLRETHDGGVGELFRGVGTVLAREAPSSFGTLLGMAWRDAGKALGGATRFGVAELKALLEATIGGIEQRGGAVRGQRTVLDALYGSLDALDGVEELPAALSAIASGAAAGTASTAEMKPQVGRAGWIGDRVVGTADAGATAWSVIAAAMRDSVA